MAHRSVAGGSPDLGRMAEHFLTTLNAARAESFGPAPAPPSLEAVSTERGHKRGLAAAASAVEASIHDIDGRWPQRSEAYEIARRAVSAYIQQIGEVVR